MTFRTQRLRDPIQGLIVFDRASKLDILAWKLINTKEFQRLRRIKQLGASDFVFPGATHTRFAHSIGVFYNARKLMGIIKRETESFDQKRADVAIIAALLHDLGHGPFSHIFENITKKSHEKWSSEIILNPHGEIQPLLKEHFSDRYKEVSTLLNADDPDDIYHAIVSSSFDADRLDYLQRDRHMTGTGAGAIDFDWLMEHIRVRDILIDTPESSDPKAKVATFCLDSKALPAAEQFLLSRYTLYEQVYFHKTTRCVEYMIKMLLERIREVVDCDNLSDLVGLQPEHTLIKFLSPDGESIKNFLNLDDQAILGSLGQMQNGSDEKIRDLASRLCKRQLYKTLDVGHFGFEEERLERMEDRIDRMIQNNLFQKNVFKDDKATIKLYTRIGGFDDGRHKKIHILDADNPKEITNMSRVVSALKDGKHLIRYFFECEQDRESAKSI